MGITFLDKPGRASGRGLLLCADAGVSGQPSAGAAGRRAVHPYGKFFTPGSLPMGVTIIDENGHSLISLTGPDGNIKAEPRWMQERSWFGYTPGFRELVLKKACRHPRSVLSILCL